MNKKRKPRILLIFGILLIVVLFLVGYKYFSFIKSPLSVNEDIVKVSVKQGDSLYSVLEKLKNEDILNNVSMAKVYIKLNNISGDIKPGEYEFDRGISLGNFISKLRNGESVVNKVTIPEGYNIEEIATKLDDTGIIEKDIFLEEVKNYPIPDYIKEDSKKRYNLEGYLFPDTYGFALDITASEIIQTMLKRFENVMEDIQKETGKTIDKNEYEKYVNMASMIEKEARVDEDRPLVSSVIYNRLEKGMPLQLDATILYSLGMHKELVTYKDLEVDSPYNTYKNKGLPVGAISNPGKASLKAAMFPEKTDYLYYLLAQGNQHYFTNNYNDFLKKKKELGY